jgi:hypothetical protein
MSIVVSIEADAAWIKGPRYMHGSNVLRKFSQAVHDKHNFEGFLNTLKVKDLNSLQNFFVDHNRRGVQQEGTGSQLSSIWSLPVPQARLGTILVWLDGPPWPPSPSTYAPFPIYSLLLIIIMLSS